jgi:hypothetical protein
VIQQVWPDFCWIKPGQLNGKAQLGPVVWYLDHRYPAPTYEVRSTAWPDGSAPSLRAWWSEPGSPSLAVDVGRFRVSSGIAEMQPIKFNGETLFAWVEFQKSRSVKDGPSDRRTPRDCLVITLQTGRHPVWASLEGVGTPEGEEHRYYDSRHYYQAVFWGSQIEDVKSVQLRLLSLEAFQKASGIQGVHDVRLDLDAPDDRLPAFDPVKIFSLDAAPGGAAPTGKD